MTEVQEILAEKFLQLNKNKSGILDWSPFYSSNSMLPKDLNSTEKQKLLNFIKGTLIERGLIEPVNASGTITRLTEKGYAFTSFADERKKKEKKEQEDAERLRLQDEKLKYDVRNVRRIYKTYWYIVFMSVFSFIYSVIKILLSQL